MIKLSNNTVGTLFALFAVLIWSGSFVIARGLSAYATPIILSFWRWTIALIVLSPFSLKNVYNNRVLLKRHLAYLCATSFIGITLFNTLVYVAGRTTTSFNLSLIALSTPIFIVAFSVLYLKEKIQRSKIIGILIVILGVMFLLTKGSYQTLFALTFSEGDLWMLVAAIIFAIYALLVKMKPPSIDTKTFLFITFFIGDLILFPIYLWENKTHDGTIVFDYKIILALLYLGIFASLIAFYLWNEAIAKIGTSKTAVIYYLIPVFSGILGFFYLGEMITSGQILSMIVIVAGLLIFNRILPLSIFSNDN